MYSEFLKGFSRTTNLEPTEAEQQWASYSMMMSDADRTRIESQDEPAGIECGTEFNEWCGRNA
jgi:hypothetical protein